MQSRFPLLGFGEPCFIEMFEQSHTGQGVERDSARQDQFVRACHAQQMIDRMDQRILKHQLRRRRLVETILRIRPMLNILDTQHGSDATTRVLIETSDGTTTWMTVGVGPNLIEASWEALTDSAIWGLRHLGIDPR